MPWCRICTAAAICRRAPSLMFGFFQVVLENRMARIHTRVLL